MKLSTDEKRTAVAALSIAMERATVVDRWRYANLRKKLETAIRQEANGG
jgi:hypothetical protein